MGLGSSKQDYQTSLHALVEREISPNDNQFWDAFWTLPQSVEDIFSNVKPDDVRKLKQKAPRNFALLFHKVVGRMRVVVSRGAKNTPADYKAALNCVRLVTRLLPFVEEDQSDDFLEAVFWRGELPLAAPAAVSPEASANEAAPAPLGSDKEGLAADSKKGKEKETEQHSEPDVASSSLSPTPLQFESASVLLEDVLLFKGEDPSDPLAIRLLNAIINLLFYPNFTVSLLTHIPTEMETFPLEQVWESGVGVQKALSSSAYMHSNRTEVLRCLLVLFSEALYRAPSETGSYVNKWLDIVACNTSFHSLALFYSLLNTALSYDPVGWGMPYNHVLFSDSRESLTDIALQVLAVLLNHEPSPLILRQGPVKNIFVEYLKTISQVQEYEWVYEAMQQLLGNPIRAHSTYLPNSTKQVSCHQELLMLFWKLIQENQGFFHWLFTRGDVTKVLDPILHFLHEARKDTAQRGLVHLCTFTLLYMSGEREFGVQLNKPFLRRLTIDLPTFSGNYADYLILVLHKMIVDGHDQLETLYECLLTILANVSPYVKAIGMVTSNKLMHLFKLLSRPRFLFANERNHRYVFFLLEVFNNFIQYQYEGNYQLIYAMIRYREGFSALARIDLSSLQPKTDPAIASMPEKVEDLSSSEEVGKQHPPLPQPTSSEPTAVPDVSEPETPSTQPIVPPPTTETEATTSPGEAAAAAVAAVDPDNSGAGTQVAEDQFIPTPEWVESWRSSLPIGTIIRLLAAIVPQIPTLVSGSYADETQILEYLRTTTLVGLLPVPHPILIRRYQSNSATNTWFTTFMWGVIYLRTVNPPLFYATHVKLFTIKMVNYLDI